MNAARHTAVCAGVMVAVFAAALCLPLRSQTVTVGINAGYMMTNNSSYSSFNSGTFGGSVAMNWRPAGDAYWQRFWRWPSFGLKASYAAIPSSPAGDRVGLNGMISAPFGRRFEWQVGVGFSAYTKPRSLTGDTTNIFIGSLVNCLIDVGVAYRLVDNLLLAVRLLHTSNGMLMRPNQGLNFLQIDFAYTLGQSVRDTLNTTHYTLHTDTSSCSEWGLSFGPGVVMSRNPFMDGYYPCYDLGLNYLYYISPVFAFGGTLDMWYNGSDHQLLKEAGNPYLLPLYLSAMATAEVFWGPVSLRLGLGSLVMGSTQISIPYYERVALYYNFGRQYVGVSLNAHGGRVEFIEWTYGIRFR